MSVKLKNKIKAVKERRFSFLIECFSEELLQENGLYYLRQLNIIEKKKKNKFMIDYSWNYKNVFTKRFIEFYIDELNIKDPLCKKIIKKLNFKTIDNKEKGRRKIDIEYQDDYIEDLYNQEWNCLREIFSKYKEIKELFLNEKERKEIKNFKKKLCQLTDCYKNPDAVKIICEKCGLMLPPETEFCSECGAEIKE